MPANRVFVDSNVLLYLLSLDTGKAQCAESILRAGGRVSVQVLNEMANVMRKKFEMSWLEVTNVLRLIRSLCPVCPLTLEIHEEGMRLAERYGLSVYDSQIVAAALSSGCRILYSEDMHHGLEVESSLKICNPFKS